MDYGTVKDSKPHIQCYNKSLQGIEAQVRIRILLHGILQPKYSVLDTWVPLSNTQIISEFTYEAECVVVNIPTKQREIEILGYEECSVFIKIANSFLHTNHRQTPATTVVTNLFCHFELQRGERLFFVLSLHLE